MGMCLDENIEVKIKDFSDEELLKYYEEIDLEYTKFLLAYEEARKILNNYNLKLGYYQKLDILRKRYDLIIREIKLRKLSIPKLDKEMVFGIDLVLEIIEDAREEKINWIRDNDFCFDSEYEDDYFGIDSDFYFVNLKEGMLPSDLLILEINNLFSKIIIETRLENSKQGNSKKKLLVSES